MVLDEDIAQIAADNNIDWKRLKNSTILVTGATGLIGSLCIRVLLSLDFPVRVFALVRDRKKAEAVFGDRIGYLTGDVRTQADYDVDPDYIIHCASVTKSKTMVDAPVDTLDISYTGTMSILRFAQKKNVKSLVYVSSMEAYGVTDETQNPVTEKELGYLDLTAARTSYSEGKRAAECLCSAFFHQYGLPVKIARLALTMGPGIPMSDNRVSMQFAKSAVYHTDIVLHTAGGSLSNFCYTSDCIRGLFTVLLKGASGEIYNICNDKETRSIREIAQLVAEKVADGSIKVLFDIPESNIFGYAPDAVLKLSSQKIMKLGWNPKVNLEDAYHRLVRYIKGE